MARDTNSSTSDNTNSNNEPTESEKRYYKAAGKARRAASRYRREAESFKRGLSSYKESKEYYVTRKGEYVKEYSPWIKAKARVGLSGKGSVFAGPRPLAPRTITKKKGEYIEETGVLQTKQTELKQKQVQLKAQQTQVKKLYEKAKSAAKEVPSGYTTYGTGKDVTTYSTALGKKYIVIDGELAGVEDPITQQSRISTSKDLLEFKGLEHQQRQYEKSEWERGLLQATPTPAWGDTTRVLGVSVPGIERLKFETREHITGPLQRQPGYHHTLDSWRNITTFKGGGFGTLQPETIRESGLELAKPHESYIFKEGKWERGYVDPAIKSSIVGFGTGAIARVIERPQILAGFGILGGGVGAAMGLVSGTAIGAAALPLAGLGMTGLYSYSLYKDTKKIQYTPTKTDLPLDMSWKTSFKRGSFLGEKVSTELIPMAIGGGIGYKYGQIAASRFHWRKLGGKELPLPTEEAVAYGSENFPTSGKQSWYGSKLAKHHEQMFIKGELVSQPVLKHFDPMAFVMKKTPSGKWIRASPSELAGGPLTVGKFPHYTPSIHAARQPLKGDILTDPFHVSTQLSTSFTGVGGETSYFPSTWAQVKQMFMPHKPVAYVTSPTKQYKVRVGTEVERGIYKWWKGEPAIGEPGVVGTKTEIQAVFKAGASRTMTDIVGYTYYKGVKIPLFGQRIGTITPITTTYTPKIVIQKTTPSLNLISKAHKESILPERYIFEPRTIISLPSISSPKSYISKSVVSSSLSSSIKSSVSKSSVSKSSIKSSIKPSSYISSSMPRSSISSIKSSSSISSSRSSRSFFSTSKVKVPKIILPGFQKSKLKKKKPSSVSRIGRMAKYRPSLIGITMPEIGGVAPKKLTGIGIRRAFKK